MNKEENRLVVITFISAIVGVFLFSPILTGCSFLSFMYLYYVTRPKEELPNKEWMKEYERVRRR